jgi:hypothetical protein
MVFQEIQSSPWVTSFVVFMGVVFIALFIVASSAYLTENDSKTLTYLRLLMPCSLIVFLCAFSFSVGQQFDQNEASFSKQLMDEYHATSNRSFHYISSNLDRSNESIAVFTVNGKDTSVLIKLVSRDGNKYTMSFNKLDEQAPYPGATN